mmetsp:Transcript_10474/g.48038  ORF Transcript_10474/g.48038 Transcript_10474/m.48038 type:complete len:251 (-) Transcript_10474:2215-2967(-)
MSSGTTIALLTRRRRGMATSTTNERTTPSRRGRGTGTSRRCNRIHQRSRLSGRRASTGATTPTRRMRRMRRRRRRTSPRPRWNPRRFPRSSRRSRLSRWTRARRRMRQNPRRNNPRSCFFASAAQSPPPRVTLPARPPPVTLRENGKGAAAMSRRTTSTRGVSAPSPPAGVAPVETKAPAKGADKGKRERGRRWTIQRARSHPGSPRGRAGGGARTPTRRWTSSTCRSRGTRSTRGCGTTTNPLWVKRAS